MNENTSVWRKYALIAIALLAIAAPYRAASATIFDIDGMVQTCNSLACDPAGIAVGDPLSGFMEVLDAASGPNSTFTEADVPILEIMVGDLLTSGSGADLGTASLTTDGDGEIVSGSVLVQTEVDTGILGTAIVDITLDAATATWQAETTFLGLGVIASGTLSFTRRMIDSDGDGIVDDADNCIEIANADQRDTNGDLFGNVCDPDLNDDDIVNAVDLGLFKTVFFTADANADFNGDGVVNTVDLGVLKAFFFMQPGPSGPAGL